MTPLQLVLSTSILFAKLETTILLHQNKNYEKDELSFIKDNPKRQVMMTKSVGVL